MSTRTARALTPRGDVLVADLRFARSPLRRMRGLLGMAALAKGRGLWIEPAPAVHTGFMRFPIDVVFLDRDHRVLRIAEHVRPWRAVGATRARVALELPAGAAAQAMLRVGDALVLTSADGETA